MKNNKELIQIKEYGCELNLQLEGMQDLRSAAAFKIDKITKCVKKYLEQQGYCENSHLQLIQCTSLDEYNRRLFTTDNSVLDVSLLKYLSVLVRLKEQKLMYDFNISKIKEGLKYLYDIESEFERFGRCVSGIDFYMSQVRFCMAKVRY